MENIENIFIRFLKENNCYYNFIKNIKSSHAFSFMYKYLTIQELFNDSNNPIGFGFSWAKSPEGQIYWNEKSRKWENLLTSIYDLNDELIRDKNKKEFFF